MPENHTIPDPQPTNHAEEARGFLMWATGDEGPNAVNEDPRLLPAFAAAQVHASLAIAEQLERLNEQLADVIDPTCGSSFPGVLRVRTESTEG